MNEVSSDWLKGVEFILNSSRETYTIKVDALISLWELLKAFIEISKKETPNSLLQRCFRHTLELLLQIGWTQLSRATKTHLKITLQYCAYLLGNHSAVEHCNTIIGLVNDPWGNPILRLLLNEGFSDVNKNEVVQLCKMEGKSLLLLRLETLCENKCEDLALNLAEAIYRCQHVNDFLFEEGVKEQFFSAIDVYIVLLYKQRRVQDIIKELKHLDLEDGLVLVKRHTLMHEKQKRLWKYSSKVAKLAADYFLAVAMVKPVNENSRILQDLLTEWALIQKTSASETLPIKIRKFIQPAGSAIHIYLLIEILVKQFGETLRPLCIELYIRALTTDLNELEQQKMEDDDEKVLETKRRFSKELLNLADLMKDNDDVCRECALTAFSVSPTNSCFDVIKELAIVSGKCTDKDKKVLQDFNGNYQNSFSDSNESIKERRTIDESVLVTGNVAKECLNCDILSAPNIILDADTLGLSKQLCDDLTVVLSNPRYHMLSWALNWTELSSECEKYLVNWKEICNPNKELNFLNIDYGQFKELPNIQEEQDESYGIEKGYEQYLDLHSDTSNCGLNSPAKKQKKRKIKK